MVEKQPKKITFTLSPRESNNQPNDGPMDRNMIMVNISGKRVVDTRLKMPSGYKTWHLRSDTDISKERLKAIEQNELGKSNSIPLPEAERIADALHITVPDIQPDPSEILVPREALLLHGSKKIAVQAELDVSHYLRNYRFVIGSFNFNVITRQEELRAVQEYKKKRLEGLENDNFSENPGITIVVAKEVKDVVKDRCEEGGYPIPDDQVTQVSDNVWALQFPQGIYRVYGGIIQFYQEAYDYYEGESQGYRPGYKPFTLRPVQVVRVEGDSNELWQNRDYSWDGVPKNDAGQFSQTTEPSFRSRNEPYLVGEFTKDGRMVGIWTDEKGHGHAEYVPDDYEGSFGSYKLGFFDESDRLWQELHPQTERSMVKQTPKHRSPKRQLIANPEAPLTMVETADNFRGAPTSELEVRYGISSQTLGRLFRNNILPGRKIGKTIYISPSAVEDYVSHNK